MELLSKWSCSSAQLSWHARASATCENGFGILNRRRKSPGRARLKTAGALQRFSLESVLRRPLLEAKSALLNAVGSSRGNIPRLSSDSRSTRAPYRPAPKRSRRAPRSPHSLDRPSEQGVVSRASRPLRSATHSRVSGWTAATRCTFRH